MLDSVGKVVFVVLVILTILVVVVGDVFVIGSVSGSVTLSFFVKILLSKGVR